MSGFHGHKNQGRSVVEKKLSAREEMKSSRMDTKEAEGDASLLLKRKESFEVTTVALENGTRARAMRLTPARPLQAAPGDVNYAFVLQLYELLKTHNFTQLMEVCILLFPCFCTTSTYTCIHLRPTFLSLFFFFPSALHRQN